MAPHNDRVATIAARVIGDVDIIERDDPAVLVDSQDPTETSLTPAWDVFEVGALPVDVPR